MLEGGGNGGSPPQLSLAQVAQDTRQLQKSALLRGGGNNLSNSNNQSTGGGGYSHFSKIAQDLAALSPSETLEQLARDDPFGMREFDTQLLHHETELGRVLTIDEIQQLFPCPRNEERITLPDARVDQKARDFREGKAGTFLFFQHLRKAGGTNFCSLAEKNLPKNAQPHYYCMVKCDKARKYTW